MTLALLLSLATLLSQDAHAVQGKDSDLGPECQSLLMFVEDVRMIETRSVIQIRTFPNLIQNQESEKLQSLELHLLTRRRFSSNGRQMGRGGLGLLLVHGKEKRDIPVIALRSSGESRNRITVASPVLQRLVIGNAEFSGFSITITEKYAGDARHWEVIVDTIVEGKRNRHFFRGDVTKKDVRLVVAPMGAEETHRMVEIERLANESE